MSAKLENQRMLAHIVGINKEEAAERLNVSVKITYSESAKFLAEELREQLRCTVQVSDGTEPCNLEVVIDSAPQSGEHQSIFVGGTPNHLLISRNPVEFSSGTFHDLPNFYQSIAAAYICSVALRLVLGATELAKDHEPFIVEYATLGLSKEILKRPIHLSETVLVGAGAIGNGFLRALRHFNIDGKLFVADPKTVSKGNLNRCLYYNDSDVGKSKATTLTTKAQSDFLSLLLVPFQGTSSLLVKQEKRIKRAIVAVDSRRTRRSIQNDLHLEIVDASTTEAKEIIVHSHKQPTEHACLSCIYKHIPDELARERDIATGLGIELEDVKQGLITSEVADRIVKAHPHLDAKALVNNAYDTLFRQLCGEQVLHTSTAGQIFAPFAFVSNLAGSLLALELATSLAVESSETNYLALSPWAPPHKKLRRLRHRDPECNFCSKPESMQAMKLVWPEFI